MGIVKVVLMSTFMPGMLDEDDLLLEVDNGDGGPTDEVEIAAKLAFRRKGVAAAWEVGGGGGGDDDDNADGSVRPSLAFLFTGGQNKYTKRVPPPYAVRSNPSSTTPDVTADGSPSSISIRPTLNPNRLESKSTASTFGILTDRWLDLLILWCGWWMEF